MIVSVVGYGKSGKTTFVIALIRTAIAAGANVAVLKTGRRHGTHQSVETVPDSVRAAQAGADPAVFWWEGGVDADLADGHREYAIPLPRRESFGEAWQRLLPGEVHRALTATDLLIVEGRIIPGARVVHLATTSRYKYVPQHQDVVIRSFDEIASTAATLSTQIVLPQHRREAMPGKHAVQRRGDDRSVTLQVDGTPVELNGYVMDVFQEVVLGLVKSLGTEDPAGEITLTVGAAESRDA